MRARGIPTIRASIDSRSESNIGLHDHIFVHTEKMKCELIEEFGVPERRITVIPFGINNAVPNTCLSEAGARERLGIREAKRQFCFLATSALQGA